MEKFKSRPFYARIKGDYALFTDPMSKGMGEKFSYQLPTYQALKGIVEAAYWKPTLYYVIDSLKVIKSIKTETKGILYPMLDGKSDLFYHTYLKDVEYLVKFHFEWNENRPELSYDRNEKKHEQILIRSLKRGGRRDIFLGTRECLGYIDYIREEEFERGETAYQGESMSYGLMFHSFVYPDESSNQDQEGKLTSYFGPITMVDGRVDFIRPEENPIQHNLGNYSIKSFTRENMTSVDELFEEYEKEGGYEDELNECVSRNL